MMDFLKNFLLGLAFFGAVVLAIYFKPVQVAGLLALGVFVLWLLGTGIRGIYEGIQIEKRWRNRFK